MSPQGSYYLQPAVMTTPGRYEPLLADLPSGIAALAEVIDDERLALFGRLAELTRDHGATFADLTAAYAEDSRLRVPATVRNAVLNRAEPVLAQDG